MAAVDDHAVEPGAEAGAFIEALAVFDDADPAVLHDIGGEIIAAGKQAAGEA